MIFYTTHAAAILFFFFFNDTATTEIYTLSLHDALPIFADPTFSALILRSKVAIALRPCFVVKSDAISSGWPLRPLSDRKSTRLNSSHQIISYAVFCLKKKKNKNIAMN